MAKRSKKKISKGKKISSKTVKKSKGKNMPKKDKKTVSAPKLKRGEGLMRWHLVRRELKSLAEDNGENLTEKELRKEASRTYTKIKPNFSYRGVEVLVEDNAFEGKYSSGVDVEPETKMPTSSDYDPNDFKLLDVEYWWIVVDEILDNTNQIVVDHSELDGKFFEGSSIEFSSYISEFSSSINASDTDTKYWGYVEYLGFDNDGKRMSYYKLVDYDTSIFVGMSYNGFKSHLYESGFYDVSKNREKEEKLESFADSFKKMLSEGISMEDIKKALGL